MARRALTAALLLVILGGTAQAQQGAVEKTGNFLSSLLGIRGSTPAEPMKLTAEPQPKAKETATARQPAKASAATAKAAEAPADKLVAKAKTAKAAPKEKAASPAPAENAAAKATSGDAPVATAALGDEAAERPRPKKALGPFRGGGSQAVCVRTCDGFFFPVNYEGAQSDDRYAEACANSCPASPTEVYFMPRGGDLKQAATARGERYTSLDTAFLYRKERNASCTCKASSQTWAEVLKPVDPLIRRGKDDIIVTPEKSLELARPVEPDLAKAEMVANAGPKSSKKSAAKKSPDKKLAKGKRPAEGHAAAATGQTLGKNAPFRNTTRFMKVDPEPTASIR